MGRRAHALSDIKGAVAIFVVLAEDAADRVVAEGRARRLGHLPGRLLLAELRSRVGLHERCLYGCYDQRCRLKMPWAEWA